MVDLGVVIIILRNRELEERWTKATWGYLRLMLFKIVHNRNTDSGGLVPCLFWGHTGPIPGPRGSSSRNHQQLQEPHEAQSQERQQLLHARIHRVGTVCLFYHSSTTSWPHLPMCKSERTLKRRSGAQRRALANQTRVVESLNITTSKIRAGVRLARTTVQTHLTQHSFLWQITCLPPQITGNRDSTVSSFFCGCFGVNCVINQPFWDGMRQPESGAEQALICWHPFYSCEGKKCFPTARERHGQTSDKLDGWVIATANTQETKCTPSLINPDNGVTEPHRNKKWSTICTIQTDIISRRTVFLTSN